MADLYKDLKSKNLNLPYKQTMKKMSQTFVLAIILCIQLFLDIKLPGLLNLLTRGVMKCLFNKINNLDQNALSEGSYFLVKKRNYRQLTRFWKQHNMMFWL